MALTEKQKRFCDEYLIDLNATRAYRSVYPTVKKDATAAAAATRLLKNVNAAAYISDQQKVLREKTEITQERVLAEYAKLAFFDPRKLFDEKGIPKNIGSLDEATAACLAGLDVNELYEGSGASREFVGYVKKYKFAEKKGALDSLAKHLGMFTEKVEVKGEVNNPYAALSTEDLKKLIGDG